MNSKRRQFLLTASWAGASAMTLALFPQRVLAAINSDAFTAKDASSAMKAAFGSDQHTPSDLIKLKTPTIAENGAVVPITVSTKLPKVESISIIATTNPTPLTSSYQLSEITEPFVSTRIKLGKTTDIIALVKSDGKLYSATKEIKVTIGGCGG